MTNPLPEAIQLTPTFDPARLANELAAVTEHRWQLQRTSTRNGVGQAADIDWRVLPLRSLAGDGERTDPGGPGPNGFAPTPWLERLPYLTEIVAAFPAPLNAVRLMALGPGAASRPHCDPKYALGRGMVRLHIPLTTNPDAILVLDGVEHRWQPGTLWWGDFSRTHQVRNTGTTVRVHTVIDALLTRGLADWFPPAWRTALTEGEVLFNRPTPLNAPHLTALPCSFDLPDGFTDFEEDDAALEGPLQPAELRAHGHELILAAGEGTFALAALGEGEYRFAGWSEQRTLQPTRDGVLLRTRHGCGLTQRHLPANAGERPHAV